jgi:hypothetical protein
MLDKRRFASWIMVALLLLAGATQVACACEILPSSDRLHAASSDHHDVADPDCAHTSIECPDLSALQAEDATTAKAAVFCHSKMALTNVHSWRQDQRLEIAFKAHFERTPPPAKTSTPVTRGTTLLI